jgi:predicted nuclease of restriction endonuclease-like (RecB) superfamily
MLAKNFQHILQLISSSKERIFRKANEEIIQLYWSIGEYISTSVAREGWGKNTVEDLAKYIADNNISSKGFSARNLWRMKQFYECYKDFPKLSPVVTEISWSNHLNILSKTTTIEEKEFYLNLAANHYYSKRDFADLIDNGTYERTILADKKLSPVVAEIPNLKHEFKDIYVFDFLNLPEYHKEYDLKKALLQNFKKFLLEMGPHFSLIAEEYVVQVGQKDFKIDLLLYNRKLSCMICVELKTVEFQPEFLGKLEFYLEALDKNIKQPHENPSIGILICKTKNEEVVQYALNRSMSPAMVAEYKTNLIPKEILQKKIHELTELMETEEGDTKQ